MQIARAGSQKSSVGEAANFTGIVRKVPLFQPDSPAAMAGSSVTFEPGARTTWHKHPVGQVLIVTSGYGWVQSWGKARLEVQPGDVVWIEPEEKHWHGASDSTSMTHTAITESRDGKFVDWMEHVRNEHYGAEQWCELAPVV